MVLIIGGAAQGKLDFARRELGVVAWSDGTIGNENCIYNLHRALRQQPEADTALGAWLEAKAAREAAAKETSNPMKSNETTVQTEKAKK